MTVHTVQSLNNECSCLPIIQSVCGHLPQLTGIHFQIWFLYSCETEEMSTVYLWRSKSHENPITNLSHLEMEAHSLIVQKTNEIPQHPWLFTPINPYCVRYGFCQPSAPFYEHRFHNDPLLGFLQFLMFNISKIDFCIP